MASGHPGTVSGPWTSQVGELGRQEAPGQASACNQSWAPAVLIETCPSRVIERGFPLREAAREVNGRGSGPPFAHTSAPRSGAE